MTFLYMIIVVFILLFIAFVIGMLGTHFLAEYSESICMAITLGIVVEFLLFQILCVPAIFLGLHLSTLTIVWGVGILLLFIFSILINRHRLISFKNSQIDKWHSFRQSSSRGWIYLVFFLILAQSVLASLSWTGHQDDNRYVAIAVDAYETDTMLCYHPFTGEYLGEPKSELIKDAVAPINMMWASLSQIFRIHPSIFMHTLLPLLFIPLCYGLYMLLAHKLMHKDMRKTALFILVLWSFNMVNHTTHMEGIGRLLFFVWWGKSILTTLFIPLTILLLINAMEQNKPGKYYFAIMLTMWSGCVTSIMAPIFLPLVVGSYSLVDGIRTKRFSRLMLPLLCCIPALYYGVLYFLVKQV